MMQEPQRKRARLSDPQAKGLDENDEEPTPGVASVTEEEDVTLPPELEIVLPVERRTLARLDTKMLKTISRPFFELVTALATKGIATGDAELWSVTDKCGRLVCRPALVEFMGGLRGVSPEYSTRVFLLTEALRELQHRFHVSQSNPPPTSSVSYQQDARWSHLCTRHPSLTLVMAWLSSHGDAVQGALRDAGLDLVPLAKSARAKAAQGAFGKRWQVILAELQSDELVPVVSQAYNPGVQVRWQRLYCILLNPDLGFVRGVLKSKLPSADKWRCVLEWLPFVDITKTINYAPAAQPYRSNVYRGTSARYRHVHSAVWRDVAKHAAALQKFEAAARDARRMLWPGIREIELGSVKNLWRRCCLDPGANLPSLGVLAALWYHVRHGVVMPATPWDPSLFMLENKELGSQLKEDLCSQLAACSGGLLTPALLKKYHLAVTGTKLLAWLRCFHTGKPLTLHATHSQLELVLMQGTKEFTMRSLVKKLRERVGTRAVHIRKTLNMDTDLQLLDDLNRDEPVHVACELSNVVCELSITLPGSGQCLNLCIWGDIETEEGRRASHRPGLAAISNTGCDLHQAAWDGTTFWHTPLHFLGLLTRRCMPAWSSEEYRRFWVENGDWITGVDSVGACHTKPGIDTCVAWRCVAKKYLRANKGRDGKWTVEGKIKEAPEHCLFGAMLHESWLHNDQDSDNSSSEETSEEEEFDDSDVD